MVAQAPLATPAVALILALGWLAVYLRRRKHPLAPDAVFFRHLKIDWSILGTVLRIGVPTGIQVVLLSIAEVAVLSLVNGFGSRAPASPRPRVSPGGGAGGAAISLLRP